ncbi:MAG: glycosyltransferase family 2 protein [Ruminococcaceae bacterium]|nr:glycosyltransferase family 2 protein [Oscillospiraceae bacterium]
MEPKVSVIVPVYNIEKYLIECLESIAAQTLGNIQVLLIDDGSRDTSGQICKDFILSHPNFEYYYKENGGTASARNVGLTHARGEYIGFVDSDDWIEPDMFETMYRAAKKAGADIIYCRMEGLADYVVFPEGVYRGEEIREQIYPVLLPHVVRTGTFRTVDWGNCSRLYRRSMVHENNIRFYEKSRRCEDFAFSVECALHADTYVVLAAGELYHYRPNENSKSRSYTKNMWNSIRSLMTYMVEITGKFEAHDFTNAMQMCIFYFCTQVIRNEMRLAKDKQRIEKIREVVTDPLCISAVGNISCTGMNSEYTAVYGYVKNQDATGLVHYLKNLAWKKKYITPVLNCIFKNQAVRKIYQKTRGR